MPPAGFETAIPTSELPYTHALDGAATGIDAKFLTSPAGFIKPPCLSTNALNSDQRQIGEFEAQTLLE